MRKSLICGAVIAGVAALPVAAFAHGPAGKARSTSLVPTGPAAKQLELQTTVPTGAAISGEFAHTGNFFYVSSLNSIQVLDTTNPAAPRIRGVMPMAEFENEAMTYGERPVPVDAAHPDGLSRFVLVGNDLVNATVDLPSSGNPNPGVQRGRFGGGEAIVVDVSDPANPFVVGRSPGTSSAEGAITTSTHTLQCASISCEYAYTAGDGEEFSIVDLRDITKPVQVKTIRSAAAGKGEVFTRGAGHYWDIDFDAKLAWHTGSGGAEVFNIEDPVNPKPLNGTNQQGTETPFNDFILHNSMRPNGSAFRTGAEPALNRGNVLLVTEEDYANEGDETVCERSGTFQTWGIPDLDGGRYAAANPDGATPDQGTIGVLDTISAPLESGSPFNAPAVGAFCSAHWFDYHQDGIVAQGYYQQGVHLVDVSDPRDIKSYGYFTTPNSEVWDAYFVPERDEAGVVTGRKTDIVYTADALRGVDVLKATLPGKPIEADTAGADGTGSGENAQPGKPGDSAGNPPPAQTRPNGSDGDSDGDEPSGGGNPSPGGGNPSSGGGNPSGGGGNPPAAAPPTGTPAPASRTCRSRRSFTIRLREPRRKKRLGKLKSARVTVNGKRVKVRRRNGRLTARVNLKGIKKTRVVVKVVSRTTKGRKFRDDRDFLTCTPKRR